MSDNTVSTLNGNFKETYNNKIEDLRPEGVKVLNLVKFSKGEKQPGNYFHAPVIMTHEHGFSYGGAEGNAFALNDAVAATMKDATVRGHEMVLKSTLSVGAASRSLSSKAAFVNATKLLVENMLKSFHRRLEVQIMYGQMGLGTVASVSGSIITVNTHEWASGIWSGGKNMPIEIKSSVGGTSRGTANISKVSLKDKQITIDNSTVAGNIVADDVLFYKGADGYEFAGIHKLITNTGTIFGINASDYELWQGNIVEVGSDFSGNEEVLSMAKIEEGISLAMDKGLSDEKIVVLVNPNTWTNLLVEQTAKRQFDSSYSSEKLENGSKSIKFYGQNGEIEIVSSIYVKEGYAYGIVPELLQRLGSSDVTFEQPGYEGRFFRLMEGHNGYELRAYTDQSLFSSFIGYTILFTYIKS